MFNPRPSISLRTTSAAILGVSLLACSGTALAQTTTNYIGPNNGFWNDPDNWDIGQVPINGKDGTFNVILPSSLTINFDVDGENEITGFIHPS